MSDAVTVATVGLLAAVKNVRASTMTIERALAEELDLAIAAAERALDEELQQKIQDQRRREQIRALARTARQS